MLIILLFLILITGFMGAYTVNFQKATLSIGKKLAPENEFLPRGMQDAITPESQNIRNVLFPILVSAIFIVALFVTKWYLALLIVTGTFFVVTPIFQQFMPKPESEYFLKIIEKELIKKLELYKAKNDQNRLEAANFVIEKINKLK